MGADSKLSNVNTYPELTTKTIKIKRDHFPDIRKESNREGNSRVKVI